MALPQPGTFALGTKSHVHLELDLLPGADPSELARLIASLEEPKATTGGANLVIGFGTAMWRHVAPDEVPGGLRDFEPIAGIDGFTAPATQHDVWVWLHGPAYDVVFDMARAVVGATEGVAMVAAEQPAFTYRDSRDLTGFIDGTENPPLDEVYDIALIDESAVGAGGSYALVQRWVHDLAAFHRLPIEEQESVIGRTKPASEELADDVRPASAHISRVVIEGDDGEELEIFRRSTPFGTVAEHGLVFVAFSADLGRFDRMLRRMAGTDDGIRDRLTEFSTPVSGAYYFVPPIAGLRRLSSP